MNIATKDGAGLMRSILQRIATGPELSKDISHEEAREGMRLVLDGCVDPVQAGIFLIALRMKRETDDEMRGILDALRDVSLRAIADVDELVDIGDPYDGYARSLPIAAFLPAVLAACGVPALSHGVASMGPKYGVTHHQVLRAAGIRVDLSIDRVTAQLANPAVGWSYIDQGVYCPKLYALTQLRALIVKRPALTTTDVMIGPVRARKKTHLYTGYVHKAYPRIYALLARHAGFDTALLVRGVEGGVIPSLRQEGKLFFYKDRTAEEQERRILPAELGLAGIQPPPLPENTTAADETETVSIDIEKAARATVEAGFRALAGDSGVVRDNLIAAAAVCLHHLDRYATLGDAAAAVRTAIDSGKAQAHFAAGIRHPE